MEINSNGRNKPTANWISNKNAIASNNVSFVSNAVRCFHWLCWLLKRTTCLLHIEFAIFWDILFVVFILLPPPSHPTHPHCLLSAWWLVTCRPTNHSCSIPLDERFVSAGPRRRIWSAIFQCILESIPTPCYFYITVAYGSYAFDVSDMWILLCNAASSQCCPRCYSDSEKKKISRCILAGHASGEFAVGGSDSVQGYEVQKHFHQGKGRGQKVQSTWSRGSAVFFFFCFTVKAGALCSQACCPERRGACCSRGRCCPEPGSCWSRPRRPGRWWRRTACSPDGWSDAHPRPQIRRPSGSVRPLPSRPGGRQRRGEQIYKLERNKFTNRLGRGCTVTSCSSCVLFLLYSWLCYLKGHFLFF